MLQVRAGRCAGARGAGGCLLPDLLAHGGAERGKASKRRQALAGEQRVSKGGLRSEQRH